VGGVRVEVIAGSAYGAKSPVGILSPTLYAHARLDAGTALRVDDTYDERATYIVEGTVRCDARSFHEGTMLVLRSKVECVLLAETSARVMLVGGARLAGERHVYWNFVSSSKERIEQAKSDWRADKFPKVPGDEIERIPLPD
jgi:redox-sensitive bicupin YhaK (pirin superfamily)